MVLASCRTVALCVWLLPEGAVKRPIDVAGTLGTVVMAYSGEPPGYEVEFCDDEGVTRQRFGIQP
jgi:hypothetical protein